MDSAPLPDLDSLDRQALMASLIAHRTEVESQQSELETAIEAASPEPEVQRPARKPLAEHLPREIVTHLPLSACCSECGGQLCQFGEDVSEQLEYIPESFKVVRHVRLKFVCAACDRVVEAPAPSRPVERSIAGPALLAHVLISKYGDRLPLYRQSDIYARQGVDIGRSTLGKGEIHRPCRAISGEHQARVEWLESVHAMV
jgi:transposase